MFPVSFLIPSSPDPRHLFLYPSPQRSKIPSSLLCFVIAVYMSLLYPFLLSS